LNASRRLGVRGTSYVELLVIVGVILTLGLLAATRIDTGVKQKTFEQGSCIESIDGCSGGGGSGSGGGGGGGGGGSGGTLSIMGGPGPAGVPSGGGGFWNGLGQGVRGFFAEGLDMVTGTAHAIAHPIQTAQGIAFAVQNPGAVWDALKNEWGQRSTAENIGRGVFQIASLLGPGAAAKLGRVADVASEAANVARTAEQAAEAAQAATRAAEAANAARAAEEAAAVARAAEEAANAGRALERVAGRGSTANPAKGTSLARNLREQLAMEQAASRPAQGTQLPFKMTDPRWPAEEGWVKMQQIIQTNEGPVNVHYLYNRTTGAIDDFKVVTSGGK
jgi:hypothetical protein